jgi:hypothetical protein
MIIIGILLFLIGIMIQRFLNKPEKPAISVYQWAHSIPTIFILLGVIFFIIGLLRAF